MTAFQVAQPGIPSGKLLGKVLMTWREVDLTV